MACCNGVGNVDPTNEASNVCDSARCILQHLFYPFQRSILDPNQYYPSRNSGGHGITRH